MVNKSHAAAYAFVAFQCAYLKYHYPLEFYTGLLTVFAENEEKAAHYITDAREHGITIAPPDINRSQPEFSIIDEKTIVYGFDSMRGLQKISIDAILAKRPFDSLEDIIHRMTKKELNKTGVTALALSGAFDSLCPELNRMEIYARAMLIRGDENEMDKVDSFTSRKKLELEKHYLGAYLSGHPLDEIARPTDWEEAANERKMVTAFGIVNGIRRILTKKGDPMAFIQISFLEQDLDAVCFPNTWESDIQFRKGDPVVGLSDVLKEGMLVKVSGRYEVEDSRKSLLLNNVSLPVRLNKDFEKHIEQVQDEKGILVPVMEQEKVVAPRTTFDEVFSD